jgi:hypothetical protein
MAEELKIEIGGDVSGATKALSILGAQVTRIQKLLSLPDLSLKQYERLNDMLRSSQAAFNKFQASTKNVVPGANSATFALTNLGRVAQDLPFGFIGIANNLNPLLESFQRLKAETGSSKAALQALGSSLIGAGGLGIALSVVTAAMSFISIGFSAWTRGMGTNKDKIDEHTAAVEISVTQWEKYLEKLKEVIATMSQEAAKVTILFGALGDSNIKLEERKSIITQLNAISGKYLGHLDAEKSSYIEISKAVEDYLKNIAAATTLKALLPEFEKITQKMVAAQVELNRITRERGIAKGLDLFSPEDEADFKEQSTTLTTTIRAAGKEIKVAKDVMADIAGGPLALEELLFGKKDQDLSKDRVKKIKDTLQDELTQLFRTSTIIKPSDQQTELHRMFNGILDDWDNFTDKLKAPKGAVLPLKEILIDPLALAQKQFQDQLKTMNDTIGKAIEGLRSTLAVGIGTVFGELLGGGFKSALGGFLTLIGDALITVGKAAIQAGIEMLALKKALTILFKSPTTAIAAGILAIAVGTAIKAKIPKFAEGGIVSKPTLGLFGEAGPEAVVPLSKFDQLGGGGMPAFVELRLKGRDAVGLIDMNRRSLNRIT